MTVFAFNGEQNILSLFSASGVYLDFMADEEIPDKNIFMMCERLNPGALSELPDGFFVRSCRPDELDV